LHSGKHLLTVMQHNISNYFDLYRYSDPLALHQHRLSMFSNHHLIIYQTAPLTFDSGKHTWLCYTWQPGVPVHVEFCAVHRLCECEWVWCVFI